MLTGTQIALTICTVFKISDVQVRATSMNDLHKNEVINDHLKEFDQSWDEALMALEMVPEGDFFWEAVDGHPLIHTRPMQHMLIVFALLFVH